MKRYIIYNSCNFGLINSQSGNLLKNVKTNVHAMSSTALENPVTTTKAIGGNKMAVAEFLLRSAKKARELKNADNTGAGTDTPAPGNQ
jgi:hypothetical protein